MFTALSSSTTCASAASSRIGRWARMTFAICRPIGRIGLRCWRGLDSASARSLPRIALSCASGMPSSSWPASFTLPRAMRQGDASRPMIAVSRIDLPLPDSPTRPTISPAAIDRFTPSSTRTRPASTR